MSGQFLYFQNKEIKRSKQENQTINNNKYQGGVDICMALDRSIWRVNMRETGCPGAGNSTGKGEKAGRHREGGLGEFSGVTQARAEEAWWPGSWALHTDPGFTFQPPPVREVTLASCWASFWLPFFTSKVGIIIVTMSQVDEKLSDVTLGY